MNFIVIKRIKTMSFRVVCFSTNQLISIFFKLYQINSVIVGNNSLPWGPCGPKSPFSPFSPWGPLKKKNYEENPWSDIDVRLFGVNERIIRNLLNFYHWTIYMRENQTCRAWWTGWTFNYSSRELIALESGC